jgi:hypothetical protein
VDAYLRVKGAPADEVYAVGDCATIESSLVPHFLEFVQKADKDENGKIDYDEWLNMGQLIQVVRRPSIDYEQWNISRPASQWPPIMLFRYAWYFQQTELSLN